MLNKFPLKINKNPKNFALSFKITEGGLGFGARAMCLNIFARKNIKLLVARIPFIINKHPKQKDIKLYEP